MPLQTLTDVYVEQLRDLYSATRKALPVTADLRDSARNRELIDALGIGHRNVTDFHDDLSRICASHGIVPTAEACRTMDGLAHDARRNALEPRFEDADARDAMIIAQYQRICHYWIVGFGCLVAFAQRLGYDTDAGTLLRCLDEAKSCDIRLSWIAQNDVNQNAA